MSEEPPQPCSVSELEEDGKGVHSCHQNCQRPPCVQRRRIHELERVISLTITENRHLARDAMRYRAIKQKIDYSEGTDGMTWAHLEWCVDVHSLSPVDLDEAIDQILLANDPVEGRDAEAKTKQGS